MGRGSDPDAAPPGRTPVTEADWTAVFVMAALSDVILNPDDDEESDE